MKRWTILAVILTACGLLTVGTAPLSATDRGQVTREGETAVAQKLDPVQQAGGAIEPDGARTQGRAEAAGAGDTGGAIDPDGPPARGPVAVSAGEALDSGGAIDPDGGR